MHNVNACPYAQGYLEYALEYLDDGELVEITPSSVRLRKRWLKEVDRRKCGAWARG